MTHLKHAVDSILDRQDGYELAEAYYEGTVSESFASSTMARLFGHGTEDYRLNFARTVVDAVNNRIEIAAVLGSNKAANTKINEVFEQNELALDANEIHKRTLIYGDCYVIVWPDANGDVEISYNSPKGATIVYDAESPRTKSYAAKMWTETFENSFNKANEVTRLNLFFADRIEKYRSQGSVISGDNNWELIDTVENPFGEVPVFHFRTSRPFGTPEHKDAWGPQDMINKLAGMHMTVVDYQGAPQRYALTSAGADVEADAFDEDDTDRENIDSLRNGPGELWYLKGVTSVGQFAPAQANTFLEPIRDYTRAMAALTNTPLHYFEKTGNVPSGEALRTAEAPLIKKVKDRQIALGSVWRDLFRFVLKIEGIKADVQVKWADVESIDSLDTWEVAIKKKAVGVPLAHILEEMGYDKEIAKEIETQALVLGAQSIAQPGMNSHNLALQQSTAEQKNNAVDAAN